MSDVAEAPLTDPQPLSEESLVLGPPLRAESSARPKLPSKSQTRRPAGGLSRPLPSPGETKINKSNLLEFKSKL